MPIKAHLNTLLPCIVTVWPVDSTDINACKAIAIEQQHMPHRVVNVLKILAAIWLQAFRRTHLQGTVVVLQLLVAAHNTVDQGQVHINALGLLCGSSSLGISTNLLVVKVVHQTLAADGQLVLQDITAQLAVALGLISEGAVDCSNDKVCRGEVSPHKRGSQHTRGRQALALVSLGRQGTCFAAGMRRLALGILQVLNLSNTIVLLAMKVAGHCADSRLWESILLLHNCTLPPSTA